MDIAGHLSGDVGIHREHAAQTGAIFHQGLELRQLHLIAGHVRAETAVFEIAGRVAVSCIGIDARGTCDQGQRRDGDRAVRHGSSRGERIEALTVDRARDDGEVGAAQRIAHGTVDVRVGCQRSGHRYAGALAGEREDVPYVGIAHAEIGTQGRRVDRFQFRSPTRRRRSRAARRVLVIHWYDGALLTTSKLVARRVNCRPSALKLATSTSPVMRGALTLPVTTALTVTRAACIEFHRQVSGKRPEIGKVARHHAGVDASSERSGQVDARVRQRKVRFGQGDRVGATIVVGGEFAGDRDAAASGSDAERDVRTTHSDS